MRKNQQGFSHIELFVVVVVLGLLGFVGWRVYAGHAAKSKSAAKGTSNLQPVPPAKPFGDTYMADISSKLSLKTIPMTGKGSQGLSIDPKTGYVYVGAFGGITNGCMQGNNQGTSYLNVVDPSQGKEVAATQADFAPIWPAVDDGRGKVYLASSSGKVGIYRLGTGEKLGDYLVGGVPHQPAFLGNILVASNTYDASQDYYTAVNLDTGQIIGNFKGVNKPHPILVDADKKIAYMMGVESGDVQVIDMTTGQPQSIFNLPGGVGQLTVSKKYNLLITDANVGGDSATFFDLTTHKLLGKVGFNGIGTPGTGLYADDASGLLFVILGDHNAVGVASLKTMKPLGYIKVGGCPYAVRTDSQRGKGFVTNTGDGTLTEFDVNELAKVFGE